jgi:hypothetical protein
VITHANLFGSAKKTRAKRVLIPPSASEPVKPLEIDVIEGNQSHKETIH